MLIEVLKADENAEEFIKAIDSLKEADFPHDATILQTKSDKRNRKNRVKTRDYHKDKMQDGNVYVKVCLPRVIAECFKREFDCEHYSHAIAKYLECATFSEETKAIARAVVEKGYFLSRSPNVVTIHSAPTESQQEPLPAFSPTFEALDNAFKDLEETIKRLNLPH